MFSKRIQKIVDFIPKNSRLADVGCDHGYVIIAANLKNKFIKAIAIDNKNGPLESARSNITQYINYENCSIVRYSLSDGLQDIDTDTDCVVIAGMGGILINNIIADGIKKNIVLDNQIFILEPNRNCYEVRIFLMNNNFEIIDEDIIYENNKFYEIIKCKKNNFKCILSDDECLFGPILLQKKNDIFLKKYHTELIKLKNLNINHQEIKNKIERIEKICL